RRADAGTGVTRASTIARVPVAWLALGLCAGAAAAATPGSWPEGDVASMPAALIETLAKAGVVGRGEPVAAFAWTLEAKRPARSPRRTRERFAGTPLGAPAGL